MISIKSNSLLKLLTDQFVRFWPYYIGAICCLCLTHLILSNLPFYAKELADLVNKPGQSIDMMKFIWAALGIIVFRSSSRLLFFYPARVMQRDLRFSLLKLLEISPTSRYRNHSAGQIYQVLNNDLEPIRTLVGFVFLQIGNSLIALVVLVPRIVQVNGKLMMALIPMFVALIIFTIIVWSSRHHHQKNQDLQGDVQNFLMESYNGKGTIKNFHSEGFFVELFKHHSFKELWHFYRAGVAISISKPLIPLGVGLALLWGAHIVRVENMEVSNLILFSGFVFLFLEPLMFVSWIGIITSRTVGAWKRICNLVNDLNQKTEYEDRIEQQNSKGIDGKLVLDFWDDKLAFEIEDKACTAFVGKTGCGKSEILKRIADILKLQGNNISLVTQAPYLYNDTIKNNIFLGREVDLYEIDKAYRFLTLFELDFLADDISSLMSMEVGENGKKLSGGQAKRLAMVKSLMSDARFLLWDDPFSSVDVVLEQQITNKLMERVKLEGKTVVLTTHRLSTVKNCDHVFFLDKESGIGEEGRVADLLSNRDSKTYEHFKKQLV